MYKGVICLADFCTCGSIIINGHCTNKSCINKAQGKTATAKAARKTSKESTEAKALKPVRTRKSSKCITYNLNDIKEEETVN